MVEASLIGAAATLAVTAVGAWIPGSPLESYFQLSRGGTIWAICIYGFVASVLPVWLLLCPRDYLSSFLKIGTIALLVGGRDRRQSEARSAADQPALCRRRRADSQRADFSVLLHLHHVRSDFRLSRPGFLGHDAQDDLARKPHPHHRLRRDADRRAGGRRGLDFRRDVLPQGNYYAINIDLAKCRSTPTQLVKMGADTDTLAADRAASRRRIAPRPDRRGGDAGGRHVADFHAGAWTASPADG